MSSSSSSTQTAPVPPKRSWWGRHWTKVLNGTLGFVVLVASVIWYAPALGLAQEVNTISTGVISHATPATQSACQALSVSDGQAGQGLFFSGVSPGCYNAGFCGQCDVILLVKNVIQAGFQVIGAIATLMFVIAGVMYIGSRGSDRVTSQAKRIMATTIAGLVMSFLAWTIVTTTALLVSGDANATIASIQCADIPAVSTCSLVSSVGDITPGTFASGGSGGVGGAGGGAIRECNVPVVEGQYIETNTGVDIGREMNRIGRELELDPVFLLTIYQIESSLGKQDLESVTGAYGTLQIQPSTAFDYWSEEAKRLQPSCTRFRSDKSRPFDGTDDGFCRHKPSGTREIDNDPLCGTIHGSHSVIEHFPDSCKRWLNTPEGMREYLNVFKAVVQRKQEKARDDDNNNTYEGIASRYTGGPNETTYMAKAQRYHRSLCKEQGGNVYDQPSGALGEAANGDYNLKHFGELDAHLGRQRKVEDITHIVLHDGGSASMGVHGMINWWLTGTEATSSHYAIDRDGTIYQLASENRVAHHAKGANRNTVGVDLITEKGGEHPPNWTDAQYQSLQGLLIDITNRTGARYTDDSIVAHQQVDFRRGRRDPREFDWSRVGLSSNRPFIGRLD